MKIHPRLLSDRDLAIILAALRVAQEEAVDRINSMPQMEGLEPVVTREVSNLCERINIGHPHDHDLDKRLDAAALAVDALNGFLNKAHRELFAAGIRPETIGIAEEARKALLEAF